MGPSHRPGGGVPLVFTLYPPGSCEQILLTLPHRSSSVNLGPPPFANSTSCAIISLTSSKVRPCVAEDQLANMDKLTMQQLRPEFRAGFDRLADLILAKAQPKQYRGQHLSGSAIASFAQAYVDVINEGGIPAVSSTWQVRDGTGQGGPGGGGVTLRGSGSGGGLCGRDTRPSEPPPRLSASASDANRRGRIPSDALRCSALLSSFRA